MRKKHVLFRVDGDTQIGLGHLVRCIALAQMLKEDYNITFFCKKLPDSIEQEIQNIGFGIKRIVNESDLLNVIILNNIVILDGYHFDSNLQKEIKGRGAKLVCIDDLHDKEFFADLIINQSSTAIPSDYIAMPFTKFALGLGYSLLRPCFLEQAVNPKRVTTIETIFICFGGSDYKHLTERTLQIVLGFREFKRINVVTGSSFKQTDNLLQLLVNDKRVNHFHSLTENEIHRVILDSDLAIIPASGILLETICCGCVPLICWYADNQKDFHSFMSKQIGLNSFGDNSVNFQSVNLVHQLKTINLSYSKALESLRAIMVKSPQNLLAQFRSLSK